MSDLKPGDIVIYLGNDYDFENWGFEKNMVTKLIKRNWVKGDFSIYKEICVGDTDIRKATILEIIEAKLLGKYIE